MIFYIPELNMIVLAVMGGIDLRSREAKVFVDWFEELGLSNLDIDNLLERYDFYYVGNL